MPSAGSSVTLASPGVFLRRAEARSLKVARLLRDTIRARHPAPELLHDLHRELRRARLDVRLLGHWLGAPEERRLGGIDRELSALSDLVGTARDRDVLGERLAALRRDAPAAAGKSFRPFEAALASEGKRHRKKLRGRAERWLEGSRPLLPALARLPSSRRAGTAFARAARLELTGAERALARARTRAARRPTVRRLHRLRIEVRRLRQLRSALSANPARGDLPPSWRRLQQQLGRHHDLGVLSAWLAEQPRTPERQFVRRAASAAAARIGRKIVRQLQSLE